LKGYIPRQRIYKIHSLIYNKDIKRLRQLPVAVFLLYLAGMKLKELCKTERPREKLLSLGAPALSNGELLAILLHSGIGDKNVLDLSREILTLSNGSLVNLFGMCASRLMSISGIGPSKASEILAAIELGKRYLEEDSKVRKVPIINSRMVFDYMIPRMKGLLHEECWVLFLNGRNLLCSEQKVGEGNSSSTVIDTQKILRSALDFGASSVVLIHNHPSGNPKPSTADIKNTESLKKALNAVQIDLMDHVIISQNCFFSFCDNKMYFG